ncbi:NAD(P)/FAD-dependent oxidoreductase [Dickeya lacustris]|uniref:FAD-binding oxidoreductase n=1 Tax=Dickeya lacustris TaxID=2259638 RepID=A0ABY8G7L6_9GAMM|nr:FAD-binding oxidoreductase [Dickeya lacustris]WFN55940.1 FAD-binding oxidoreductase [Dickeya lacustris]
MNINALPLDANINGWSAMLPPRAARPALRRKITVDWLIIGAGYAGLAFARRVAENRPHEQVVVLDARDVDNSASARNSGFAIDLPHNIGSSTAELEKAANYRRLLHTGLEQLQTLIDRYGIACDWQQQGKYHCIVRPERQDLLAHYARELDALAEPYQLVQGEALARKLGTPYYHAAIYTPHCVLLNPAALVRGLADNLPDNVTLYEDTPALAIHPGQPIRVTTPYGEVSARQVMVATNGCARQLPMFAHQVVGLSTFATLTEPLTPEQQQRIGELDPWGMTPANAIAGATLRYTRDGRFLIRQHVTYAPGYTVTSRQTADITRQHQAIFLSRFAQLADVPIAHSWSGMIGVTRNGAPGWGKFADNLYAAVGCNGAGISKQTVAGSTLADLACGVDNALIADMQALGKPNMIPPRPLLDMGIRASILKERWLGRHEY